MSTDNRTEKIIRPYKSFVFANDRKLRLLQDTYDHLRHGSSVFFHFLIALMGGLTPEMVKLAQGKRSNPKASPKLACAIHWFRSMDKEHATEVLTLKQLISRFIKYYGESPDEVTIEYFTAPMGEKYQWVDCRSRFHNLCKQLRTTTLTEDLTCLIEKGLLPIKGDEVANQDDSSDLGKASSGIVSGMFGDGEKSNLSRQCKVLANVLDKVKYKPPRSYEEASNLLLKCAEVKTFKQFFTIEGYGKTGSRPCSVVMIARGDYDENDFDLKAFIKTCEKEYKKALVTTNFPNKDIIKKYLKKHLGEYHPASWKEMLKHALNCIVTKNTRNGGFAFEKQEAKQNIKKYHNDKVELLNGYFKSEYSQGEDFCICPWHVGDLKAFYQFFEDEENQKEYPVEELCDAAIDHISQLEREGLKKPSMKSILAYIFSKRDQATAEEFQNAAKYNAAKEKYDRQKIHPTVEGNQPFSYGNSLLNGRVIPPHKKHKGQYAGQSYCIWIEACVLDKGKWVKHHFPTFNSRFYEEVYYYNPNNTLPEVTLRTKQFGVDLSKYNLAEKHPSTLVKNEKNSLVSAQRRIQRLHNDEIPNVQWPEGTVGFSITKKDDRFCLTISYPVFPPKLDVQLQVGDVVMSIDQGQTKNHAYALYEVTTSSDLQYAGFSLRMLETGPIRSETQPRKNLPPIDQLSYPGLDKESEPFKEWIANRKAFIDSLGIEQFQEAFNDRCNRQYHLYSFNHSYLKLLKNVINGKLYFSNKKRYQFDQNTSQQVRDEIIEMCMGWCSPMRLSSLSFHSLSCFRELIRVIHAYLSIILGDQEKTLENKQAADPELFALLKKINDRYKNKRKERTARSEGAITKLTVQHNVKMVFNESELPTTSKKASKKQNRHNMDWCSRDLANRLQDSLKICEVQNKGINPHYTSHQDPFEYTIENKVMYCRMGMSDEIPSYMMEKFAGYMKCNKNTATQYYRKGMEDFIQHYGLEDVADLIKKEKISATELTKLCKKKRPKDRIYPSIVYPMKGGRFYLSTHCVTSHAIPFVFNGRTCYIGNADEVAAVNIMLYGLKLCERSNAKKKAATARKQ